MKHFTFIFVFLLSFSLFSQNIKLLELDGSVVNDDTLEVVGLSSETVFDKYLRVTNAGSSDYTIWVTKTVVQDVTGSGNEFCWAGQCYLPYVTTSNNSLTMSPGDTVPDFSAHFRPFGNEGTALMKYEFYDSTAMVHSELYIRFVSQAEQTGPEIVLMELDGTVVNDDTLEVVGLSSETVFDKYLRVTNSGSSDYTVWVTKTVIQDVTGSGNEFCWAGQCYLPYVTTSNNSLTMSPGDTVPDFSAHFRPFGNEGTALMKYEFYDSTAMVHSELYIRFISQAEQTGPEIVLMELDGTVVNDDTLEVVGLSSETVFDKYLRVTNSGSSDYTVWVTKTVIQDVTGSGNEFCWAGQCYLPYVVTSNNSLTMSPGDTVPDFSAHFRPFGNEGTALMKYEFYDSNAVVHSELYIRFISQAEQSGSELVLLDTLGNVVNEDTLYVAGTINDNQLEIAIHVVNEGDQAYDVFAAREEVDIVSGTNNEICWAGQCYLPFIDTSQNSMTMNVGDTITEFAAHYSPNLNDGTSLIKYTFFDNQAGVSSFVYVEYKADTVGAVDDLMVKELHVYPNPVSDMFYFESPEQGSNQTFELYNSIGNKVLEKKSLSFINRNAVDVSTLPKGIYIYRLIIDNNVKASGKVIKQ